MQFIFPEGYIIEVLNEFQQNNVINYCSNYQADLDRGRERQKDVRWRENLALF